MQKSWLIILVVAYVCPSLELSIKPGYIAVSQKSKSRIPDGLRIQELHSRFEPLSAASFSQVTLGVSIISLTKPFSDTENSNCGKQTNKQYER